ncbi:protein SUPPRESSOR OF npr1-1, CONSTITUTIVE 1-like [Benincasa hispida]|uniref:protein SUPPRESSOR OF npr1-1, CONSTITUTIVE 1-like n=1 Tax=Benincasa hispida TaxID=102211 RepID=UPI00190269FA|nr:protein SUPPRESSOR OF npr1-1, CONSTITUTIVE 1-like [Benincasa hispida]
MHIQGRVLSLEKEMDESLELDTESFSEKTKLRILKINNVELSEDIEYLSQLLQIINWPGYPSKSLPPTFQVRYLFGLLLPHSHILRLWDGKKVSLKTLNSPPTQHRIWKSMLPQFNIHQTVSTGLGCLKTLNLMGCKLMDEDIPEDLHCFSSLETLDLSYNKFTTLPDSLSHLNKLKTLNLNFCTELKDLPKRPDSLQYVGGIDCRSMSEQYYNKILLIPSNSGHQLYLNFIIRSEDTNVECAMNLFQHSIFTRRSFVLNII